MSSRAGAKQHLRNAFSLGYCKKFEAGHELIPVKNDIICQLCLLKFECLDDYYNHVVTELAFPRVQSVHDGGGRKQIDD